MNKKALITGSLGQDGQFLSEKLLSRGYEVFGVVKKNKVFDKQNYRIFKSDLTNLQEVDEIISQIKPTHIFNFAGVSDIFDPYVNISNVYEQNCKIPLNLVESIINNNPEIKFFQASSSLMYENGNTKIINENSEIAPKYPYGISKASVFAQMKELREEKNLFLSTGILFNHDSEKRGKNFFTQKVVLGLKDILEKKTDKLFLGNLNVYKDISYAEDFVDGIILQMELDQPEDFVFGSAKPILLHDFVSKCFNLFGMDYRDYVVSFEEKKPTIFGLVSEPKKAKDVLNWTTKRTIDDIVKIMIKDKIELI